MPKHDDDYYADDTELEAKATEHSDHLTTEEVAASDVERSDHFAEVEIPPAPVTVPEQLTPDAEVAFASAGTKACRLGHMATPGPATGLATGGAEPVVSHNVVPHEG